MAIFTARLITAALTTTARFQSSLPPVFKSISASAATVTLVWSTVAGQTYQLQYSTNLAQTNWNNLGNAVVATNGTMTVSESIGTDPQRFYRVVLQ